VRFAGAVEIEMNGDARLKGGARHFSGSGSHHVQYRQENLRVAMIPFSRLSLSFAKDYA
jgi:hypothetical protein